MFLDAPISTTQRERSFSKRHELPVDFIDFAAPVFDAHVGFAPGRGFPAGSPGCQLRFKVRIDARDGFRGALRRRGAFDFLHQRRADHRGIGQSAEHGNVPRQRNAEADGDRKAS